MASVEKHSASDKKGAATTAMEMIEKLPQEVFTHLLGFMNHLDCSQLASCNTLLEKIVCKDCKEVWVNIDLSKQDSLTDDMLAALLARVKQVTKSLDIRHCNKLTGAGLAPLSHSKVFEKIYMHGIEGTMDVDVIVPFLRTMLPYKLFHVGVNLETIPDVMIKFLRKLHTKRYKQAHKKHIQCVLKFLVDVILKKPRKHIFCHCLERVADQNLPSADTTLQCAECARYYCFDPMRELCSDICRKCGERGCGDCKNIKFCTNCWTNLCGKCVEEEQDNFVTCSDCNQDYCGSCASFYGDGPVVIELCHGCLACFCPDCKSDIEICCNCEQTYCEDCYAEYATCSSCCNFSCNECLKFLCTLCGKVFCENCGCSDDHLDWCDGCETGTCKDCSSAFTCVRCHVTNCNDCSSAVTCVSCDETYCNNCSSAATCFQCKRDYFLCQKCNSKLDGFCCYECFEQPRKKARIEDTRPSESD